MSKRLTAGMQPRSLPILLALCAALCVASNQACDACHTRYAPGMKEGL